MFMLGLFLIRFYFLKPFAKQEVLSGLSVIITGSENKQEALAGTEVNQTLS